MVSCNRWHVTGPWPHMPHALQFVLRQPSNLPLLDYLLALEQFLMRFFSARLSPVSFATMVLQSDSYCSSSFTRLISETSRPPYLRSSYRKLRHQYHGYGIPQSYQYYLRTFENRRNLTLCKSGFFHKTFCFEY